MNIKQLSITLGGLIIILIGFSFLSLVPVSEEPGMNDEEETLSTYQNAAVGLSFEYRAGQDGYVIQEFMPREEGADEEAAIVLMKRADVEQGLPEAGEGPPAITIAVFKNTLNQWSGQWADAYPQFSNIARKTSDTADVVVGGANAIRYTADGLYMADTIVVASSGFVYVLSGMFTDANDPMRKDFESLVASLEFIPLETAELPQGKLDIRAVCESALAYMTFTDGAVADLFVAECVEGKHPEVIERYKADLNLDGAAI